MEYNFFKTFLVNKKNMFSINFPIPRNSDGMKIEKKNYGSFNMEND